MLCGWLGPKLSIFAFFFFFFTYLFLSRRWVGFFFHLNADEQCYLLYFFLLFFNVIYYIFVYLLRKNQRGFRFGEDNRGEKKKGGQVWGFFPPLFNGFYGIFMKLSLI